MPVKKDKYDYLFRIVIIGDSGVGKTNLLFRYTKDEYYAGLPSTIGIDFSFKNVVIDKKIIRAYIWDTAGQDKFRSISTSYYHGSAAALLVYDITNYESFLNVTKWLTELKKYADENIVVMLVGNKSDLPHLRKVTTDEAKEFAIKNNLSFIETSALNSYNVEIAFQNVINDVYTIRAKNLNLHQNSYLNKSNVSSIKINQEQGLKENLVKKCC